VKYVFRGNAPQEEPDGDGGLRILRPLDTREFDEDPGYPWELLEGPFAEPEAGTSPPAQLPPRVPPADPVVITPDGPRLPATGTEGA
jgi:hypothetical protein